MKKRRKKRARQIDRLTRELFAWVIFIHSFILFTHWWHTFTNNNPHLHWYHLINSRSPFIICRCVTGRENFVNQIDNKDWLLIHMIIILIILINTRNTPWDILLMMMKMMYTTTTTATNNKCLYYTQTHRHQIEDTQDKVYSITNFWTPQITPTKTDRHTFDWSTHWDSLISFLFID